MPVSPRCRRSPASAPTRSRSNASASGCSRTAAASFATWASTSGTRRRSAHRVRRSRPPPTPLTWPRSRTGGCWRSPTPERTPSRASWPGRRSTLAGIDGSPRCADHSRRRGRRRHLLRAGGRGAHWSQEDRDFGACAADMAALFLEQADRLEIEASLRARRESELADERMAALGRLAPLGRPRRQQRARGARPHGRRAGGEPGRRRSAATAGGPARRSSGRPAGRAADAVRGGDADGDARVDLGAVCDRIDRC